MLSTQPLTSLLLSLSTSLGHLSPALKMISAFVLHWLLFPRTVQCLCLSLSHSFHFSLKTRQSIQIVTTTSGKPLTLLSLIWIMQILMSGKLIKRKQETSHWQSTSAVMPGGYCYKREKNDQAFNSSFTGVLIFAPQPGYSVIRVAAFLRAILSLHVRDNTFWNLLIRNCPVSLCWSISKTITSRLNEVHWRITWLKREFIINKYFKYFIIDAAGGKQLWLTQRRGKLFKF